MWYDEQLAVTKHLYLPFKSMTIWVHALSFLGGLFPQSLSDEDSSYNPQIIDLFSW